MSKSWMENTILSILKTYTHTHTELRLFLLANITAKKLFLWATKILISDKNKNNGWSMNYTYLLQEIFYFFTWVPIDKEHKNGFICHVILLTHLILICYLWRRAWSKRSSPLYKQFTSIKKRHSIALLFPF